MHHILTFTPPAFTDVLRDAVVKSGQHLRLRCQLSSLPTHPYTVTWTKNKLCIENDDNIIVVKDGCTLALDLTSTETADTGHYKCTITCASRRISCSAYVAVIGKNLSEPVWLVGVTSAVFGNSSEKRPKSFRFVLSNGNIVRTVWKLFEFSGNWASPTKVMRGLRKFSYLSRKGSGTVS